MTKFAPPIFPTAFSADPGKFRRFDQDLLTALDGLANNLKVILDAGLDFDDNVDCVFVTYTTNVTANTEDTVAHGLGKVPVGFAVVDINKAGVVYRSNPSTSSSLFLKCSTVSTAVTLLIF